MYLLSFLLILLLVFCLVILLYSTDTNSTSSEPYECDQETLTEFTKVWVDHLIYTRLVFVAFFANSSELNALRTRLIKNQSDIGNLFGKLYGQSVGNSVTKLLLEHINIAVDVLTSIKTNNAKNKATSVKRFYANANEIGTALDNLKNTNGIFKHHMKTHIDTLINTITSHISKKYVEDIKNYDIYVSAGLDMAYDMCKL